MREPILGTGRFRKGTVMRFALLVFLGLLVAPAAPRAQAVDKERAYQACMRLAEEAPDEAFEEALAWQTRNGGWAAEHCAAVALIGLGQHGEAAIRLEALASRVERKEIRLATEILAQAGQAWQLAGEMVRAVASQSAALELDPRNIELLIDRGISLAAARNYWEAIDDLNRAADLDPARAEILILRASAYKMVDAVDLARADIGRAMALEPRNLEGLLERGILRRLDGDDAGAREDWLEVVTLAPDSAAAKAARANLEKLDVKVE